MLGRFKGRSMMVRAVRAAVLALPLLVLAPGLGWATDILVTTTTDEENTDGDCSLREAIRAANLNQARDACPAGSTTARDTVTLASGATYSLTIPPVVGDLDGLNGSLNLVNNNSAPADLLINVANGGTATISQDAVPDDPVFATTTNGNFEIDDVVIKGGTGTAGSGGGAISVINGTTVVLQRCVLTDHFAPNNGGAIFVNGAGATLTMDGCVVAHNVATNSAGAISVGSGTVATINDTLFEDNVASNQSGGAIRNTGLLTVTSSSFVDNRAFGSGSGGAVHNSAAAVDAVSITGSCFTGNNAIAVDSFIASAQDATGNWWGASDGPSGTGPGSGDEVGAAFDFSDFLSAPPAGCRPQQLLADGGFELDDDDNGLPDRWRSRRLQTPADGVTCSAGACVLAIGGDTQINEVLQTMHVPGVAGDSFTFSARSSATAVPETGGKYLVELSLIHADGSKQRKVLKFSSGNHGAEERSKTIVASEDYVRLKVRIEYSRASGTVRFDDVSVVLEP